MTPNERNVKESRQQALSPPSISPPKGGGAIRGISEKFSVNPMTGTSSLSFPIFTSSGRLGFEPQLSLSYDSGQGNGPFGIGWTLSLPSITRKTDKGLPMYQDATHQNEAESDIFILSGAEDLVPAFKKDSQGKIVCHNGNIVLDDFFCDSKGEPVDAVDPNGYIIRRYRPRTEGLFARIERWTRIKDGDVHWRSISKDNILTVYGRDDQSRISDPTNPNRVYSWLLCESYDDKGNAIHYEYVADNTQGVDHSKVSERSRVRGASRYLKRIWYGNRRPLLLDSSKQSFRKSHLEQTDFSHADWMFEIVFDYDEKHYKIVPLDENKSRDEQHQYVDASASPAKAWSTRPDPFSSFRAGFEVRTYRRCQRVLMFHIFPELGEDPYLVRSTEFDYADLDYNQPVTVDIEREHKGSTRFASFIRSVTQSGYVRVEPQTKITTNGVAYFTYLKSSLPPLEFDYSRAIIDETIVCADPETLKNLPVGVDGSNYRLVDLDGEGLSGIVTEQAGSWFYKPNLGNGNFGQLKQLKTKPSLANLSSGRQQLLDLAGDGQLDLADFADPVPGFYERTFDQNWKNFTAFGSLPNISWNDPNLKFVDLTGDGHADILIAENQVLTWYPSLAEDGFDQALKTYQPLNEEDGPRPIFADETETLFLSDMSGDGLVDLVRVRNGEVCYWPNLGYGRFGAKITMENAPWFDISDQFNPKRIHLADIDGSGTTDIIYLGVNGVQIYFNQSGNSLSDLKNLSIFPQVDNLSSVQVADLLGNGTVCLVWSSSLAGDSGRQMRYVDLMGGEKPHLLVSLKNNLGAETKVHYVASTHFYLEDKEKGNPWITRLPFPVYVVDRVETCDYISHNRFVTFYKYHHGFFDGIEREFRGFGLVEQFDTEEVDFDHSKTKDEKGKKENDANWNHASFVPPVLTRTWFHTGAYFENGIISKHFEDEYYHEGDSSLGEGELTDEELKHMLLPDTILPDGLTTEEAREACRALKGSILRQEVYALDRDLDETLSEKSDRPYTTSERNYTVKCLQSQECNQHAVFFVYPRETVNFNYERKLYDMTVDGLTIKRADPRVTHDITIEVDDYGNTLKSISVGYGRRQPDATLAINDQNEQSQTLITYTENSYTNPIGIPIPERDPKNVEKDAYRIPLQCETRTFEIINLNWQTLETLELPTSLSPEKSGVTNLFPFDALQNLVEEKNFSQGNWDIPNEDVKHTLATDNHPYRRPMKQVRTFYRSNRLDSLLALGQVDSLALPGETYKLAFTPGLIAAVYHRELTGQPPENLIPFPSALLGSMNPDGGGYVDLDGNENWWIPSGRVFYSPNLVENPSQELDFAVTHFFLPYRFCDPFGNNTIVTYDSSETDPLRNHNLLLTETSDALNNKTLVGNDYRVLQPVIVTDPNGAITEVLFDALGLVVATALHKENIGDSLQNVLADLTQKHVNDFFANPKGQAETRLGKSTTCIIYDKDRYYLSENPDKPPYVATVARETHASDPVFLGGLKVQIGFSYSDGFGRDIQKKIYAEPGPVEGVGENVDPRWVGSGWTIFNNKGKPIKKYEPFFDDTHEFRFGKQVGVSSILFYDPVERVVATLHPNNTYEKVVFDPWQQKIYDANDNVTSDPRIDEDISNYVSKYFATQPANWQTWYELRTSGALGIREQKVAQKTEAHANTPTTTYFDALGRTFLTVANNGKDKNGNEIFYRSETILDIEGSQREVIDSKGRIVVQYDYDMQENRIKQASIEAGTRWVLSNVLGKPIRNWDSRNFNRRMSYDALQRPVELSVTGSTGTEFLAKKIVYGEYKTNPETTNHRLKTWMVYDGAGVLVNDKYDFKGNLVLINRQLLSDYKVQVDWTQDPQLDTEIFSSSTTYDALNRPIQIVAPKSNKAGAKVNVIQPVYNEANLLERVDVWLELTAQPSRLLDPTTATQNTVKNINYNAKGQRDFIEYGNGVTTTYEYDSLMFRLIHMQTVRSADKLQDLFYTRDPVGNITFIRDDAQQTIFFNGQVVRPDAEYKYDAIYRLIEADGREHIGQVSQPHTTWSDKFRVNLAHPNDGQKMRNYFESYEYDEVGNLLKFEHKAQNGNWIRSFNYNEASLLEMGKKSNRLSSTVVHPNSQHPTTEPYNYDSHGNMTSMPHLQQMDWDFEDQLHHLDKGTEKIYFVYDAAGQRVRKVVEKNNGVLIEERVYLGGFEIFRRRNNELTFERETLHIMHEEQRIALIETRTIDIRNVDLAPRQLVRYQLGNHIGSALLELDDKAKIVSYEENSSYGSTTYQAIRSQTETPKRYRFTGKERDEESGLYYFGARYYAPQICRWIAVDPADIKNNLNVYVYVSDRPIMLIDPDGREEAPAQKWSFSSSKPGFGESIIPIWGSIRDANYNFDKGNWGWGLVYTGLAISDVFLVKSIVQAVGKGILKAGGKASREVLTKEVGEKVASTEIAEKVVAKDAAAKATTKEFAEKAAAKEAADKAGKEAVGKTATRETTKKAAAKEAAAKTAAEEALKVTGKIAYGATDLGKKAIQYRKAHKLTTGNVAVFEYLEGGVTKTLTMASKHNVGHAERLIAKELEKMGIDPKNVTRIYSELQPCNYLFGGGCTRLVQKEFGQAAVTFSFEYGSTQASRAAGVALLKEAIDQIFKPSLRINLIGR